MARYDFTWVSEVESSSEWTLYFRTDYNLVINGPSLNNLLSLIMTSNCFSLWLESISLLNPIAYSGGGGWDGGGGTVVDLGKILTGFWVRKTSQNMRVLSIFIQIWKVWLGSRNLVTRSCSATGEELGLRHQPESQNSTTLSPKVSKISDFSFWPFGHILAKFQVNWCGGRGVAAVIFWTKGHEY